MSFTGGAYACIRTLLYRHNVVAYSLIPYKTVILMLRNKDRCSALAIIVGAGKVDSMADGKEVPVVFLEGFG